MRARTDAPTSTDAAALRTHQVREMTIKYSALLTAPETPQRVSTTAAARAYMRALLPDDDARECFGVLALDAKHRVIGYHVVSIGTTNASLVHPREVFRFAIAASAVSVVVGHNHPSGDTTPSPDDLQITRRLVNAGEILGISLVDHIITGNTYGRGTPDARSLREDAPQLFRQ